MIKTLFIIVLGAVVLMGCSSTPKVSHSPQAMKYHVQCHRAAAQEVKANEIKPQTPLEAVTAVIIERQYKRSAYHNCMRRHN